VGVSPWVNLGFDTHLALSRSLNGHGPRHRSVENLDGSTGA
jgi:hypothetical protein